MTPKTILLATDLSARSDRALDRAVSLATEWNSRLIVLHVLTQAAPVNSLPSWRQPSDAREAARQRIYNDLPAGTGLDIEVMIAHGDPAMRIQEAAEQTGCDLVVTGTARDETLGRILLGTTVDHLARNLETPLLVVKFRPRAHYRKLVVATDFSEGSRCALTTALALLPAASISLFHAYNVPHEGLINDRMSARRAAGERAAEEGRAFLAATPAAAGRSIELLCEYGEPGALLEDLTQARGIDLVVLGSEGRSSLAQVLLGSVAELLLLYLTTDVLLVHRKKDRG